MYAGVLRSASWLAFFALILWAWWWLYSMSVHMGMTPFGTMRGMGSMGGMAAMPAMDELGVLVPMWVIMMAAMMGPTFVPTVQTYEDLIGTGGGTRSGFVGVIAGYFLVWFGFGAAIAMLHALLRQAGLLSAIGGSASVLFSAALLITAGLYQFTTLKDRCLEHCRSPMSHFLANWREGALGGVRMGAGIAVFCVGCCWSIMLIGFVGGAMNLVWMGIATAIMTLEKLPDIGRRLTLPLGVCFLAAGVWMLTRSF